MPTLLTWNIARAADDRLDAVASFVRGVAPDLLLLQEAVEDSRRLKSLLGGEVRFVPAFPLPGGAPGATAEGMALWSPARLHDVESTALGGWPWPRVALRCRLGGLTVCNLHLSHLPWQRQAQLRAVAAHRDRPLLLAGDFNRPGGCRLAGFTAVVPAGWSFRRGPLRLRLDAALVSPGVRVAGASYLSSRLSDHRPMLLRLGGGT